MIPIARVVDVVKRQTMLALLIASVVTNVALAQKVRAGSVAKPSRLAVGQPMRPFIAKTVNGQPVEVNYGDGRPAILYYFSATCGWCERNWANVKAVAEHVSRRYRFIAVATSPEAGAILTKHGISVEVVTGLDRAALTEYHFSGTPSTVVIANGKVVKTWEGAWTGNLVREVESFFEVRLPGLTQRAAQ